MSDELKDSDRFLLFMALLAPSLPERKRTTEELIRTFIKVTGWEENRARSAFEVCVLNGHIGEKAAKR